jgi:hypothetical protein
MNGEASSSTLVEDLASNHKEIKVNKINDDLKGNNEEHRGFCPPRRLPKRKLQKMRRGFIYRKN